MTDSSKSGASGSTAVLLVVKGFDTSDLSRVIADFRKSIFSQSDDAAERALNGVQSGQPSGTDAIRAEVRADVNTAL